MKNTNNNYFSLLMIILSFLLAIPSYSQDCTFSDPQKQAEYDAMIDFYNANSSIFNEVSSFSVTERYRESWREFGNGLECDICSINQIECNSNGYITIIDFSGNLGNFTSIPASIGNLSSLEELVHNNSAITSLPESIGNLTNLQRLKISDNRLTSLPVSISNLTNLQILTLTDNQITSIPESIGNLTNLKSLTLTDNQITSIPESIGDLTNLESLGLSGNQLTSIPESIGNLTNLKFLNISGVSSSITNQLTSIPASIGNLINLESLNLSGNQLSILPESMENLINLELLAFNSNQITMLPENIGNLSKLITLYFSNNQVSFIPKSFGNLSSLKALRFSDNQIDCLPQEVLTLCSNGLRESIFMTSSGYGRSPSFSGNPIYSEYSSIGDFCTDPTNGICSDSGGGSDPYLTGNTGSENCSVWIDSDNDGICDDADICEGGDDYIDINGNGIPDACDDASGGGTGGGSDPYLTGNTGSENCSVWIDSDNDGICDDADICEGGDDYIDINGNGIPDACDDTSGGGTGGGTDPYLTGNTGNENCTSPWIDTDGDGSCDAADVCEGGDDFVDSDSDYLPDACDTNGQGYLTGNTGTETCSVWIDGDNDGICDDADVCQGADDFLDTDGDGIPDGCDPDSYRDTQARVAQPERLIAQKIPGRKVNLTWAANEANTPTLYTIQHSTDGLHYKDLFTFSPRDQGKIEVYYDQHENPSVGNNFYRLKIDYLEKSSEYYEDEPLFFVPLPIAIGIAAFPNPTKDILHVNLSEIMETSVIIKLHTMQGVELKTIEIDANHEEVVELDMRPYNNGLYTLTIKPSGFRAVSQKVVISNTD